MKNSRCFRLRYIGIAALLALQGMSMLSSPQAAECYSTPRTALDALITKTSLSSTLRNDGYRVIRIDSDQVLGQRWAMIAHCGHPEWPVFAVPANGLSSFASLQKAERFVAEGPSALPIVRAGEVVQLWRRESLLRIEVAGVSEESGGLGKTIRVRLLHRNTDDQAVPEQVSGVIRGPANVEMQP
jgi:hypothetical protein